MRRLKQIAWTAHWVRRVSRFKTGQLLLRAFQRFPVTGGIYRAAVGYHRPFSSLEEANIAVESYADMGHEHPVNASQHLEFNKFGRPSDYAALFHIQRILPEVHEIFDLGGNVGNLFYLYSKDIGGLSRVTWRVLDLPAHIALGEEIAKEREAHQLKFTQDWADANGVDLLLVSGSLHYFERSLAQMVIELRKKPKHILVNRTPLTDGAPVAAVQDKGDYRVACMLYNKREVIGELTQLGYVLVDEWRATELSMEIPGYPEHRISAYSGFFMSYKGEGIGTVRVGTRSMAGTKELDSLPGQAA